MKHAKTPGKGLSGKLVALLLALTLVIGCVAGGTVAWLTANGGTVTNTFTFGDIDITLEETNTTRQFKVIPGVPIAKDPKVTVQAGSEACWLFVKVEESTNWPTELSYQVISGDNGWTELTNAETGAKVYYREVAASESNQEFYVLQGSDAKEELKNGVVNVADTLTKEDITAFKDNAPTLTFTAYAVQYSKDGTSNFTAAEAWQKVTENTPTP